MTDIYQITKRLRELADLAYKAFQSPLIPTVPSERLIGVRIPQVRKLAREIAGTKAAERFLESLPHAYYDENNLHAFLIEQINEYEACMAALERFLPHVDNWATCDLMAPKVLGEHLDEVRERAKQWLQTEHPYTVRYGINLFMRCFLKEHFDPIYLEWIAVVSHDDYYVRMAVAWYFATALTWQYEAALPYLEQHRLSPWIHQKTIQKAIESYRIPEERKDYLKTLRLKSRIAR